MKNNVKALRKARNMTQPELAKQLGVSIATIQNWEGEKTDMTGYSLAMLCDFFSVSPDEVYGTGKRSEHWLRRLELIGIYDELPEFGKKILLASAQAISDVCAQEVEDALNEERYQNSLGN